MDQAKTIRKQVGVGGGGGGGGGEEITKSAVIIKTKTKQNKKHIIKNTAIKLEV